MSYVRNRHRLGVSLCAAIAFSSAPATAQLANTPWASFGGDAGNTHLSAYRGPEVQPIIKWEYATGRSAHRQPIISADGGIIFTTHGSSNALSALERDGSLRWERRITAQLGRWVSADVAGRVYFGTYYYLQAVDQASGSAIWTTQTQQSSYFQNGTTVGPDGSIYAGYQPSSDRMLSFDTDGNIQWTRAGGGYGSTPAIAADGSIVTVSSAVRSYSPAGDLQWTFDTPEIYPVSDDTVQFMSAAISPMTGHTYVGQFYINNSGGYRPERLYALDTDGQLMWSFDGAGGSPAIGPDGTIYAGHRSTLVAINPDGTEKWRFDHGSRGDTSASSEGVTIDADGNLYLTNAQGMLYSLNPSGDLRWALDLAPETDSDIFPTTPIIDFDGTLYVGTGYGQTMLAIAVPEPHSLAIFGALTAAGMARRRRR